MKILERGLDSTYLSGGSKSTKIGISELFHYDVKGERFVYIPVVMFYLPPDKGKEHIAIFATNQAQRQRIGFVTPTDEEQPAFLYAYGNGLAQTPDIPNRRATSDMCDGGDVSGFTRCHAGF